MRLGRELSFVPPRHRSAEACHNGTPAGLFRDRQQHQTGIRGTSSNPHLPEQRTPKQCVAACSGPDFMQTRAEGFFKDLQRVNQAICRLGELAHNYQFESTGQLRQQDT